MFRWKATACSAPGIQEAYDRWPELLDVADRLQSAGHPKEAPGLLAEVHPNDFNCPVPAPRQVFAIGLNYADHAAEASFDAPENLTVFTKFISSFTGPYGTVTLPSRTIDWEVELVVVIGRSGRNIAVDAAWDHVAGLAIGQDLSNRAMQLSGPSPQFSLAKSFLVSAPLARFS